MKKIITLFTAALLIAGFAHAQTPEDARDVILGKKKRTEQRKEEPTDIFGNRRSDERTERYPSGSAEAERDRINREYDYKIQTIRNNNALSAEEKRRMIDYLNKEREKELRRVRNYDDRRYDDDDRDERKKDKRYKSNRGKHKGWEKGKGNKHRDRNDD
jgi:hypothetical protein